MSTVQRLITADSGDVRPGDVVQVENTSLKGMVVSVVAAKFHQGTANRYTRFYDTSNLEWYVVLIQIGSKTYLVPLTHFYPSLVQWHGAEILHPATWTIKEQEQNLG